MARNSKPVPKQTEKVIYQEASSRCSLCAEDSIPLLDIHHIVSRADGGSNEPENLLLVCKNCHARIESGEISQEKVERRKKALRVIPLFPRMEEDRGTNNLSIEGNVSSSIVANNIVIKGATKLPSRMNHPLGSIGANLDKKNYIADLIKKYHTLRDADPSYDPSRPRKTRSPGPQAQYSYAVIHRNIERKFRAKTYFVPESRFDALVEHLQHLIDETIQGKRNRSDGYENYASFQEYVREYGRGSE